MIRLKLLVVVILVSFFTLLSTFSFSQSISDVLENTLPAVVTVSVERVDNGNLIMGFRGSSDIAYEQQLDLSTSIGTGSGFVIKRNGQKYVVTNAHVVESASEEPESIIIYSINRTRYEMRLLGGDSFYDIAVLEFVSTPGTEITAIDFRSDDIRLGERVFAIGNPLGEYPYTISDGIIGAKNRVRGGMVGKFGFLQSTASVIWGNSGGPLIDENGLVVGINSQITITSRGDQIFIQPQINLALEAEISNRLVNDILNNNGRIRRSFLGIELSDNFTVRREWGKRGFPVRVNEYPQITGYINGSPATALAPYIGALVTHIEGNPVRTIEEALGAFENILPGSDVSLKLQFENGSTTIINIQTNTLTPELNAFFAKRFFDMNSQFDLNASDNIPKLWFGSSEWVIVAAGLREQENQKLWRVQNVNDLATALRFMGSYGVIDFVVARHGEQTRVVRQTMSQSDHHIRRILWY